MLEAKVLGFSGGTQAGATRDSGYVFAKTMSCMKLRTGGSLILRLSLDLIHGSIFSW
jgi:hypothetical protein